MKDKQTREVLHGLREELIVNKKSEEAFEINRPGSVLYRDWSRKESRMEALANAFRFLWLVVLKKHIDASRVFCISCLFIV
jgi:hypothetical protein